MKSFKILYSVLSLSTILSPIANAEQFDWSACKSEIAQFCPNEKDDEKIWACLQTYDIDLSSSCDKEHSVYEHKTGKTK
jgi:hypothetical protein